jgi:hypothetical protein
MLDVFLTHGRKEKCGSLQRIFCSGEELSVDLQNKCLASLPHARLHNLYGPTEAAIDVTYWECRVENGATRVPIGRPIANTQIYILDSRREPVPIGVTGELYIGGVGVARGYLNRPDLTADRFIPDPFDKRADARMYKTGDLARWRRDGNVEYLGRNDHQVKIRGFRIELGEIESQLVRHPQIREAVVVSREDVAGEKRLVAYITRSPTSSVDTAEVRTYLRALLPEYMVPSSIVVLDELPLTPNGKLDRRALPAPEPSELPANEYVAPRTPTEKVLADIVALRYRWRLDYRGTVGGSIAQGRFGAVRARRVRSTDRGGDGVWSIVRGCNYTRAGDSSRRGSSQSDSTLVLCGQSSRTQLFQSVVNFPMSQATNSRCVERRTRTAVSTS